MSNLQKTLGTFYTIIFHIMLLMWVIDVVFGTKLIHEPESMAMFVVVAFFCLEHQIELKYDKFLSVSQKVVDIIEKDDDDKISTC